MSAGLGLLNKGFIGNYNNLHKQKFYDFINKFLEDEGDNISEMELNDLTDEEILKLITNWHKTKILK